MSNTTRYHYTIELPNGKIEQKNSTALFTHALIMKTDDGYWFTQSLHRSEALAVKAVSSAKAEQRRGWFDGVIDFDAVAVTIESGN